MTRFRTRSTIWLLALFAFAPALRFAAAQAQDSTPLANEAAPPAKEGAGPTEEDVAAAKAALEKRRREEEERQRLRPVLEAIAETNPTTPLQLIGAINSLIDLDQPEEAKKYIQRLLALKLNDEAMFVLQRKVGSGVFIKLSADNRYHPEGQTLASAVLAAAQKQARDPQRIAQLIGELSDASPSVRALAVSDLKDAGDDAVLAMIAALADGGRAAEHAKIRYALYQMGEMAVDPLLAALGAEDDNLRQQAIEVLGLLKSSRATPYLIHPLLAPGHPQSVRTAAAQALTRIVGAVPSQREAQIYLRQRVEQLAAGDLPKQAAADGTIEIWLWNPQKKSPVPVVHSAGDAALVVAARLAADLYDLWPDNAEYRRIYLMAMLESSKLLSGLDHSLPGGEGTARSLAAAAGAAAVEDVLVQAMREHRPAAAIAAVEVLGDIGDEQLLLSDDGRERPLVQALTHGNRRLRYAAAEALIKIDPRHDYPGASHLPDTLGYLASSSGTRRVLIGHPRTSAAQSIVGMLDQMGFEAVTATSGRALFLAATSSPDFEMIFLSDAIDDPPLAETLQLLRRDRRTAGVPIALMVREKNLRRLQLATEDDPITAAFPRPHDPSALEFQVRKLIAMAGRDGITDQERVRHASAAMAWLSRLAENPQQYGFYDLLRVEPQIIAALYNGPVPARAAEVLGLLGASPSQTALVQLASQNARPVSLRQAAAEAFDAAARRRGLLLRDKQIDQQYQRYNQSASLDAGTQAVLGQILDTIERELLAERTGQSPQE